jgi:hypothetical protein
MTPGTGAFFPGSIRTRSALVHAWRLYTGASGRLTGSKFGILQAGNGPSLAVHFRPIVARLGESVRSWQRCGN